MKRFNLVLASIGFAFGLSSTTLAADDDWAPVAQALGRSGAQLPGGIYRVGLGRSDLKVTLDGVEIRPTLALDRKSTRLNSSHSQISYAVFCLKKKKKKKSRY